MDRKSKYTAKMKRRVLVVDDEYVNREMLSFIISKDYEVLQAEDGEQALSMIREYKNSLSLVVLDLLMPNVDGFTVLKTVKADESLKNIPIIVLTSEDAAEVESLKLGAADFIKKPYDVPEIILARIARTIELFEDMELIKATERDQLTQLYTKEFFFEYVNQLESYYPEWDMDAVILDIRNFQLINDLHGREYGDNVLKVIAEMLRRILSEQTDGYACRYHGDLFYIYCRHIEDYDKIHNEISRAIDWMSDTQKTRIILGVYPNVDKSLDMEHRFDRARLAVGRVKGDYSKSVEYYDAKFHENSLFKQRLINDIHDAIDSHQLMVYFQPKYAIQGDKPRLSSAEALVRWNHPELGVLNPGSFIPLFEENGLIQILDHYVWEAAAAKVKEWRDRFSYEVPVSVNVSRMDLYDEDLLPYLLSILDKNGINPHNFMLEITESAYAKDSDYMTKAIQSLRDRGFLIEMDDFGSGYSSLNMLSELPFDVLKLDMNFVKNMHINEKSLKLVELVLGFADYMTVPVVAEGVEYEEQYEMFKQMGCAVIQGYFFSKPVSPEQFEDFIQEELQG